MNVVSVLQIQRHIPIATALAFSGSDITLLWIPEQILWYLA